MQVGVLNKKLKCASSVAVLSLSAQGSCTTTRTSNRSKMVPFTGAGNGFTSKIDQRKEECYFDVIKYY